MSNTSKALPTLRDIIADTKPILSSDLQRMAAQVEAKNSPRSAVPAHYDKAVTPWDLERCMESSGHAFVDARRSDAIEYSFRIKDDLLSDLRKARHCLDEAIKFLDSQAPTIEP